MKVAVLGATGTLGSRTAARLKGRGAEVVEVSRASQVDLITGAGLRAALEGADAVVDTSNPFPPDDRLSVQEALTSATRNVVEACAAQGVQHLVAMSICGVEKPVFDGFPYYLAKRAQEEIVEGGPVPATVVRSTQWHEFATNPAAVTFHDDEVLVEDWLIQPVAADAVADVLVDTLDSPDTPHTITGPEVIALPELTARLLERRGDPRPVRATPPALPALADGVLRAPNDATVVGPDVDTWLQGV